MKLVKRPPPATIQFKQYRAGLKTALQPSADKRANAYGQEVKGWQSQHKPDFVGQVAVGPKRMFIRVILKNGSKQLSRYGGTIRDLWKWWNEGTGLHGPRRRAYPIFPRFKSVLRFVVGGTVVFAKYVNKPGRTHPGMRGSKAKERIDKKLKPVERREVKEAGEKALRRIND